MDDGQLIYPNQEQRLKSIVPQSKTATLFEQLGATSAISRDNTLEIDLEDGASEPDINPLPDLSEIVTS